MRSLTHVRPGLYKTASIAASPLLRPRRVNQKSAKIYSIKCKSQCRNRRNCPNRRNCCRNRRALLLRHRNRRAAIEGPQQKRSSIAAAATVAALVRILPNFAAIGALLYDAVNIKNFEKTGKLIKSTMKSNDINKELIYNLNKI